MKPLSTAILCVVGPTASGKTEVAYQISKLIPVEAISCDSMQVYKSMPVLTQSPPKKILKKMKTHLVNFLTPEQEFSAALFRKKASELIPKILAKKKTPLIVGGTGLYLRALLDGLFDPAAGEASRDEAFRQKLLLQQERRGGNFLHEKLKAVDAVSASKIHPNDIRRVVRALEVFHLTKKTLSEQKHKRSGLRADYDVKVFFLNRDRQDLYGRINSRVDLMMKEGLSGEVKRLMKKKLSRTAAMALGFREMKAYLQGEKKLEEALTLIKRDTRHYAKRQIGWFRYEKEAQFVEVVKGAQAKDIALSIVKRFKA